MMQQGVHRQALRDHEIGDVRPLRAMRNPGKHWAKGRNALPTVRLDA